MYNFEMEDSFIFRSNRQSAFDKSRKQSESSINCSKYLPNSLLKQNAEGFSSRNNSALLSTGHNS